MSIFRIWVWRQGLDSDQHYNAIPCRLFTFSH
nr:MAG TPA: hypothetical protein [Caudoviricetes sp.]